ncbi:arsenate reductase/protein-tyrosine-phosphatase family protein [Mycolicibacterium stellerae]|uniref:arsenate reductase/protein-tyrosine-phosphatase family protein n=1 Tax=Mycolicibacterium stellerae TaxID=2358193 RepID=UPI000F0BD30A|nr:helix-turn-helix domain-containing protein [Mycolicibacterium stellerae]
MNIEQDAGASRRAAIHAALGDPGRLAIVDRLLLDDASPSELQVLLSMPSNLLAHHVRVLEAADVVRRSRSEGDRRRTYLSLNAEALETLVPRAAGRAQRVVFVCTENSARSQLAVAVWNRHESLPAASAGIHPAAEVHPGAIAAARRHQLPVPARRPQHIDDVLASGDLLIAVCDNAHEELPRDMARIHWSIPDPSRSSTAEAFDRTVDVLTARIDRLVRSIQTP